MIALIQLVSYGKVTVDEQTIGAIDRGILALIGIEKSDTDIQMKKIFEKIINYRIFPDEAGKTNLSLKDIQGGLLLVPQFTLVAETQKGLRPGFSRGMDPSEGKKLFMQMIDYAKQNYTHVAAGSYGDHMLVSLCNDGPMTFILQAN